MAPFVTEGLGEYPRLVFANQAALIGPESDPAQIEGMHDVVAAFNKIAQIKTKAVLVHLFTGFLVPQAAVIG